jgi:hypothetical protein
VAFARSRRAVTSRSHAAIDSLSITSFTICIVQHGEVLGERRMHDPLTPVALLERESFGDRSRELLESVALLSHQHFSITVVEYEAKIDLVTREKIGLERFDASNTFPHDNHWPANHYDLARSVAGSAFGVSLPGRGARASIAGAESFAEKIATRMKAPTSRNMSVIAMKKDMAGSVR